MTTSLPQIFDLAVRYHQQGNLHQAESLYRQILQADPRHVEALHLLGVIAHQVGNNDLAVKHIQQALRLHPKFAAAHNNLGSALMAQGKPAEALPCFEQALALQPDYSDAGNNLGLALAALGRLDEAVNCYRQILRLKPDDAEACNNLGIVLMKQNKFEEAMVSYRRVLRLRPNTAQAYHNLGNALKNQGLLDEAVANFRQALRLKPDLAESHNDLGNALKDQRQIDEAISSYRQALHLKPDYVEAYSNLGTALYEQGKLDEAIASYRQALRLKSDFAEVHYNLGSALAEQGKSTEAIASYREALLLKPDFAEAHYDLGNALRTVEKFEEAIASYQHALQLTSKIENQKSNLRADAYNSLGIVWNKLGKIEEAAASYRQALRQNPDFIDAYNNLGNTLLEQGKLEEATASYRQVVRLQPDFAEGYNNLGNALTEQCRFEEAIQNCRQALRLKPDLAEAYNSLGNALCGQGELEEAITSYQQAVRLKPDIARIHSNLIFTLPYHPGFDSAQIRQEARRWNDQHAQPLARFIQAHANRPDPDRRLRIGYLSPHFRDHCQSFFTMPLLSNHDRGQGEIFCYADDLAPDAVTLRLRGFADVWRSTVGISDQQVADMIRSDQIDILVDLTMHMARNRMLIFARKPAPVQVAWLAYPGTTGLAAMDYRLTDPFLDPVGEHDDCYSEQSIRLPDTFWCYDPLTDQPHVNDLPALAQRYITFGCLNNFCKVNEGTLRLWGQVLRAVPRSRLLMLAPQGPARDRVLAILRREGIDEGRVELADRQPRRQYLQLHHRIDLSLDPLPSNGHTTSLDAFWMGVPTITLIGATVLGRAGWSQASNLKLRELVAHTSEEYVEIAVKLTDDLARLSELRRTLRGRMEQSPLMNAPRFARGMEQCYRQMWRNWCEKHG